MQYPVFYADLSHLTLPKFGGRYNTASLMTDKEVTPRSRQPKTGADGIVRKALKQPESKKGRPDLKGQLRQRLIVQFACRLCAVFMPSTAIHFEFLPTIP
jgi:hypothetical protein